MYIHGGGGQGDRGKELRQSKSLFATTLIESESLHVMRRRIHACVRPLLILNCFHRERRLGTDFATARLLGPGDRSQEPAHMHVSSSSYDMHVSSSSYWKRAIEAKSQATRVPCTCVCLSMCVCVCVCVYVCVCEREREYVCVCVYIYTYIHIKRERERERERERYEHRAHTQCPTRSRPC